MKKRKDNAPITLDFLKSKTEEVGECWIWQAGKSHKIPHLRATIDGQKKSMSVKRWIAEYHLKLDIKGKLITSSCFEHCCVNPDHIKVVSRKKLQQMWTDKLQFQQSATNKIKQSIARQKQFPRSDDLIQRILESNESCVKIAKKEGVSKTFVNNVKTGRYVKYSQNFFRGLG